MDQLYDGISRGLVLNNSTFNKCFDLMTVPCMTFNIRAAGNQEISAVSKINRLTLKA